VSARRDPFAKAREAVFRAFRWYCCEPNADQKGCASDCPRRRALAAIDEGAAATEPAATTRVGEER
jgi:hypothetical protein